MPTQTFFNLDEDKKERIIAASIDEFANYSISNASIQRIVKEAGIPRGSFYQYFTDIKDLYRYIFTISGEKKIVYMGDAIAALNKLSTFEVIRELYKAGIRFANENPKLAQIGNRLLREDVSIRQEIVGDLEKQSQLFFEDLLKKGKEKGDINSDLDVEVGAFLFYSLNFAIVDRLLSSEDNIDLLDKLDEFLDFSNKVLFVMENGMKSKN